MMLQRKAAEQRPKCHERLRRKAKEVDTKEVDDSSTDDNYEEQITEYVEMFEEGPAPFVYPIPMRTFHRTPSLNTPPSSPSPRTSRFYAAASTATGSRPIFAWSAAHD